MARQRQEELKGMPPKGKVVVEAESFISVWEELKDKQSNFKRAKERFATVLRKHPGLRKLTVKDSAGINRTIRFDHKESITIVAGKRDRE